MDTLAISLDDFQWLMIIINLLTQFIEEFLCKISLTRFFLMQLKFCLKNKHDLAFVEFHWV